jgi:iron complex outermembrane receptor protein
MHVLIYEWRFCISSIISGCWSCCFFVLGEGVFLCFMKLFSNLLFPLFYLFHGQLTADGGQPVPFAHVLLLQDTVVVKTGLTDENGFYLFDNIPPGTYTLRFSSVGYQTVDIPADTAFHVQLMTARSLGEVVVRGSTPFTVVNPANSLISKGSTALAVLERSPGVLIDQHTNGITLNGKTGVTVMLNGKVQRMSMDQLFTMLNSMPADNIEKIELMDTPSSKYDAEGSAGIINIVLKKNRQASYALTAGYGKGEKAAGNINLSHNNLYGAYSFSHDRTYGSFIGKGTEILVRPIAFDFNSFTKRIDNSQNVTIGYDGKSFGGSVNYSASRSSATTDNHGKYVSDSLLLVDAYIDGVNRWRNFSASAYAEFNNFHLDVDYLYYNNYNPTSVTNEFPARSEQDTGYQFSALQRGLAQTSIQVGVVKLDYTKQLSSSLKLEAGIKGAYTHNESLSGIQSFVDDHWVDRSGTTNDILMQEGIAAAYTSFDYQISASTSLVLGARYEYSHIYDRDYRQLFPSLFFSHKGWQFSYTKRISRPAYNDLASYVTYNDPLSVFTGNPLLKPTITNNLKVGYSYFSLLFSSDNNPIVGYQLATGPSKNLAYITPQNLSWKHSLTFQANLPFKAAEWWNMSYNVVSSLNQFKADYTVSPVVKTYFFYSLNFSESFKLPKQFAIELSGVYNSPSYYGTLQVDPSGVINLGVRKNDFTLSVYDLLRTNRISNYLGTIAKEAFDTKYHVVVRPESSYFPIIKLTYSRSFGGAKKERKDGAKDERERVRG